MSRSLSTKLSRACRQFPLGSPSIGSRLFIRPTISSPKPQSSSSRYISISSITCKGITPESADPQPKARESNLPHAAPAELSQERYNELSDQYMGTLVDKLEALAEERENVDVEYSAGVLTLNLPPTGVYVINKQPPNKQIWLSSPTSGPKRYDFVVQGEGQDAKEGTGTGEWVYLRDGSSLSDVLLKEVGVDMKVVHATPSIVGDGTMENVTSTSARE